MKPRTRSLIPASIGSNQASPANRSVPFIRVVVLSCSMAWSPPARQRRSWLVEQAGGYAQPNFHHIRDGTDTPFPLFSSELSALLAYNEMTRRKSGVQGMRSVSEDS